MNKKVYISLVALVLTFSTHVVFAQSKMITPKKLSALMVPGANLNIIDLRTDSEWSGGKIDGAVQINFYAENFQELLNELDKSETYYIYCKSGGRSGQAASIMEDLGFTSIYDLKGGITRWRDEGYPTKREEP